MEHTTTSFRGLSIVTQTIVSQARQLLTVHAPILIAFDGGSGSGKSTISALVETELNSAGITTALIQGDDFYAAHIPDAEWDRRSPQEKAQDCIDWQRLRSEALEPLLAGRPAIWHPFDFGAGSRPDGTYTISRETEERPPGQVIILDGAYSTRPELVDLIDLSILVDVPIEVRHARLVNREEADFLAEWHQRWDVAEAYYFTHVRPTESFDLVVN